jgi:hypothetical protein
METQDTQIEGVEHQQPKSWHALAADETISRFDTPADSGLSSQKAAKRIKQYGSSLR